MELIIIVEKRRFIQCDIFGRRFWAADLLATAYYYYNYFILNHFYYFDVTPCYSFFL